MFEDLKLLPPDPILGMSKLYADDPRDKKIDLGVGVFRTLDGRTPIMEAVSRAEAMVEAAETTKVYTPADGFPGFNDAVQKLVFGADHPALKAGRVQSVQTPGGCGALRIAAELLKRTRAEKIIVGSPTWANHIPLMSAAGLKIETIPFYDASASAIEFDGFMGGVKKLGANDVLLLHNGCHNPTGADLSTEQIDAVLDAAEQQGFLPLIDTAYHGFARDLESDAYLIREAARRLPEVLITYSCSKNFGLYRERTGAAIFVGADKDRAMAMKTNALNVARENYSMPPAHGGAIVAEILGDPTLTKMWKDELADMCATVRRNRRLVVETAEKMGVGNRLSFIAEQNGMFSLLPLTPDEVKALREKHGVYAVALKEGGRINLCGVNAGNVEHLVEAFRDVSSA